jgi:hypothetical protein
MNKLVVLALLLGATLSGKIPLHKRKLTMGGLLNLQDRLAHPGSNKFLRDTTEEIPISDYENTQYFA